MGINARNCPDTFVHDGVSDINPHIGFAHTITNYCISYIPLETSDYFHFDPWGGDTVIIVFGGETMFNHLFQYGNEGWDKVLEGE